MAKILISLFLATSPLFFTSLSPTGAGAGITIDPNFGYKSCDSTGTCIATSATGTVTVGSGQLRFDANLSGEYQKNGGAWTTFSSGQLLTVALNDTLAFRRTCSPLDDDFISVVETATGIQVGWAEVQNICSGCP